MRYWGMGFLGVGVEGGRFSGNPVSGADSECNREVTGKEAASGGKWRQVAAPDRFAPKSDDFAAQAVLTSRAGGTAGVHLLPLSSPNSL